MSTLFDRAVMSTGAGYLLAEVELRQAAQRDDAGRESIRQGLSHPDPIARLLAQVTLDWQGAKGDEFNAALAYLDRLPDQLARTAMGTPSPTGTESYLTLHFGDRVTELLALRLAKQEPGPSQWPAWRALAVVFYLARHKVPSTTPTLIRFAIQAPRDEWRQLALDGIRAMADKDLPFKAAAEIARARDLKYPIPKEVRALAD